eukprot:957494_1
MAEECGTEEDNLEGGVLLCQMRFDHTHPSGSLSATTDYVLDQDGRVLRGRGANVRASVCVAGMAETAMKEVHVNKSLDAIGVGFYNGASFIFPGRPGRSCDEYDPRVRPWYLAASSAPKDVVLILDTSGSMSLHGNLDQQKAAANLVLSTLNLGDYFGVVAFGTGARFVTNPHMMPATMESIEHAQQAVDALSPYGSSDMLTGFEYAFDMLENSIASTANRTSNCKRII